MHVWSLAKVFHTCGKNCGKSRGLAGEREFRAEKLGVFPEPERLIDETLIFLQVFGKR
jgi:hypothetical protein